MPSVRQFRGTRANRGQTRRWLVLVAGVLAGAGALASTLLRGRYLRVAVAGESMTPALEPDEFLVLRAGPPPADRPYGHIVAVEDPRPEAGGRLLLKRIVGLPGESLRVGGGVQVNGRILDEPYAHGETPYEQHRGINRLAEDEYFLLGDHRGGSTDSRDFGPVRRDAIIGTVAWRYWPPERIGRLRPPPRVLFGVASEPSPAAPAPTTHPLTWLHYRAPDDLTPPASSPPPGQGSPGG